MKKFNYIFLAILLAFASCTEELLDKKPLDIISDADLWNDTIMMDSYLTNAYLKLSILKNETPNGPLGNFNNSEDWNGPFIINEVSDEGKGNWIVGQSKTAKMSGITINGGILEWWENAYFDIRILNEFIQRVPESMVSESYKKRRVGEARFLRAYNYFAMVKRYGGVPLITKTQGISDSYEELYRRRDPEQAIYDFIISEMDAIFNDLPDRTTDYGRPCKYTAMALKSRAALYAASIAKYGTVQLDGILGIPASKAPEYFQQAFDAAKIIITSAKYSLYKQDANKVTNFKNIFLVKNNVEVMWAERHDYVNRVFNGTGNGWIWDFFQCPKPHGWNAGNQNAPYLEMAEEYEHVDGSSGKLDWTAIQQGVWSIDELWGNKDPRFYATIYTQNTPWKGGTVDFHNGLLKPDGNILNDGSYQGVSAKGTQSTDNSFGTGFGVMKLLEESKSNMGDRATSGTDWILFRYAEVLLNYAEAAYELGKTNDALETINQIRNRAGIAALGSIDLDKIRHERKVELAFEGHRYWDLRRWRIATSELTVNRSGIRYILDYETKNFKIVINKKIDGATSDPIFNEYNYYFPITVSRTGNNPNLVENPGYQ